GRWGGMTQAVVDRGVCGQRVVTKSRQAGAKAGGVPWGERPLQDGAGLGDPIGRRFRRRLDGRNVTPNRAPKKSPVFEPAIRGHWTRAGSTWNARGDLAADRPTRYSIAPLDSLSPCGGGLGWGQSWR